jgi:hypothetical protein
MESASSGNFEFGRHARSHALRIAFELLHLLPEAVPTPVSRVAWSMRTPGAHAPRPAYLPTQHQQHFAIFAIKPARFVQAFGQQL